MTPDKLLNLSALFSPLEDKDNDMTYAKGLLRGFSEVRPGKHLAQGKPRNKCSVVQPVPHQSLSWAHSALDTKMAAKDTLDAGKQNDTL